MANMGSVIKVVVGVSIVYLLMLVVMPILGLFATSANVTITASGVNITAHPGSTDILFIAPWFLWFVPASIGMVIIVAILKRR